MDTVRIVSETVIQVDSGYYKRLVEKAIIEAMRSLPLLLVEVKLSMDWEQGLAIVICCSLLQFKDDICVDQLSAFRQFGHDADFNGVGLYIN